MEPHQIGIAEGAARLENDDAGNRGNRFRRQGKATSHRQDSGTSSLNQGAVSKGRAQAKLRLRTFKTGGSMAAYEAAKAAWDAAHPGADYREREQAMRRLARAMGV